MILNIRLSGYDPNGPTQDNLRTITAAIAYDDAITGKTVILVVHQAIHLPNLHHNLLSTMQLRFNDVIAHDVPRFLTDKPTLHTHLLLVPTDSDDPYIIPLTLHGVASSFPTRKPTMQEYETLPHVTLTSENPPYYPHDESFATHENELAKVVLKTGDRIGAPPSSSRRCLVSKTPRPHDLDTRVTLSLDQISVVHDYFALATTTNTKISGIRASSAGPNLTPKILATNWDIDLKTATQGDI
jgi:hypothetical protein